MENGKLWIKRIGGGLLAVFGLIFGANIGSGRFCLGDRVFQMLGLPVWSNADGNGGHYPAYVGLFLICVGLCVLQFGLERRHRQWVWPGFILFWILFGSIARIL